MDSDLSFIVYALPRSRTVWLSRFLSYGDWTCGHDELRHARSMEDVASWFAQPNTGTVETMAAPWWRLVPDGMKTVVIRRPVGEVIASLMNLGIPFDAVKLRHTMGRLDHKLDQIERRVPNALSVRYRDLSDEGACAELFEFCLPYARDPQWWDKLESLNLQINMRATMRYWEAFSPQLLKLAKIARLQAIRTMRRPESEIVGVDIAQEPFETFLRDGKHLFDQHLTEVGEAPGDWKQKNLPMMRSMYDAGALIVTTARSNGRMFGYLMTIIGPSLEKSALSAMNLTFYASKDIPRLGMKLQNASRQALKARGVEELFLRAGPRGAGPRLGIMYARMGAEDFGKMYRLDLVA